MALFKRKKPESINDPALPDTEWFERGATRFEQLRPSYGDGPDELLQATRARLAADDPASAVQFVALAVQRLEAAYLAPDRGGRTPGDADADRLILGSAWTTFTSVQRQRPAAPITGLAAATSARLGRIAEALGAAGESAELVAAFTDVADDLAEVSRRVAPPPPPPDDTLSQLRELAERQGDPDLR